MLDRLVYRFYQNFFGFLLPSYKVTITYVDNVMLYYNESEIMSTNSIRFSVRPHVRCFLCALLFAAVAKMAVLSSPAFAEETRQLDSHEHGVGELNIAVDGDTVAMELHAPGADIVGFEYVAKSIEDRTAIEVAVETLSRPLDLFVMPAAAECRVIQAAAVLETEKAHEAHDDHEAHENEHSDEVTHTGFHAIYTLTCRNLVALSEIRFAYFDMFENARELEVQIVSASGAQAFEVGRDSPTLDLRGTF